MYDFIDVNEVSEGVMLPSEALQINGEFIENIIPGYRTLNVSGRESLSRELTTFETGTSDGETVKNVRYPLRTITVKYQLMAKSNATFREAFNTLSSVLNVKDAELIFNDEPNKFFIGTPGEVGEIEPGTNSIIGTFELFCADPFKYSVEEYEVDPELTENTFLIDYSGTHKAFPVLEAEFYGENESDATLTGNGDCGYVAFFNEDEKIIQIGDPDETDAEDYAKSQTLVNQSFQKETAWNAITEANWATNAGKLSSDVPQVGSVGVSPSAYATTTAPGTSGALLSVTSKVAKPNIAYSISAQTSGRTENSIKVKATISAALVGSGSASTSGTVKAGAKVTLNKTKLYTSSTATSASGTRTGTYYLWDGSVKSGRIRITNASSNVGKSGQVTGWVNVSDINLSGGSSSSVSLGTGAGLKASIQFNGGDWYTAILKSENSKWSGTGKHTVTITATVKGLEADTTLIEDIKFKVERSDNNSNAGELDETICKDLEVSAYTAPVISDYYLTAASFGVGSDWHGPSITRTIPADASGHVGAANFTMQYAQKIAIGYSQTATQEQGLFQALAIGGSGSNRRIIAGVGIFKNAVGKTAKLRLYVNHKVVEELKIDLSYHNKYFGNNNSEIKTVKTSTITKTGNRVDFNVGGIKKTFYDDAIKATEATQMTFYFAQANTKTPLFYNGLYRAKFIKNNCDTYADVPNKFSANDVVTADCKTGIIYLNGSPAPSLGALGNDWEDFYLKPGMNQIGFSFSDWVPDEYAPKFKLRYREVFI